MKYYFIAYQAKNRDGSTQVWNDVIDISPMQFIKQVIKREEEQGNRLGWRDFVVNFAMEISKAEYEEWKGRF